jgi:hypothetical protein
MDVVAAAQFANDIGRFYQVSGQRIGDYLHQNIGNITTRQLSILSDDQTRLISYSNTFFSLSDQIAFDSADDYFTKVTAATLQINDALKKIKKVDDIITLSAAVISLAGGIISRSGGMITSSLGSIAQSVAGLKKTSRDL